MVPAYGVVGYNNYVFPATYELKVNSVPVYNDDNTSVKYVQNTLTASFIVTQELIARSVPPYSTDREMVVLRTLLEEPRQELAIIFQGSGFGAKRIVIYPNYLNKGYYKPDGTFVDKSDITGLAEEPPLYINDIGGGPLPKILNWEPIGTNRACKVTWSVDFTTLRCPFTTGQEEDPIDYTPVSIEYDRSFGINEEGVVKITTSGFIEVPTMLYGQVGQPKTQTILTADSKAMYQKSLLGKLLLLSIPVTGDGFVVKSFDRNLSRSGNRLEFTQVVEEHPSPNSLFPYSIKINAKHKVSSSIDEDQGFLNWTNRIPATITVAPGYDPSIAFNIFMFLVYQRYALAGSTVSTSYVQDGGTSSSSYNLEITPRGIVTALEIEEDIYSRTHSFLIEYLGIFDLEYLLSQSRLFTPIYTRRDVDGRYPWEANYKPNPLAQWVNYHNSVTVPFYGNDRKGYRDVHQNWSFIFDPCLQNNYNAIKFQENPSLSSFGGRPDLADNAEYPVAMAASSSPVPSSSGDLENPEGPTTNTPLIKELEDNSGYVAYHNEFSISERTRVYPIGIQDSSQAIDNYKISTKEELSNNNPYYTAFNEVSLYGKTQPISSENSGIASVAGGSDYIITINGYGVRYGKGVPVPGLVAIKNNQVVVPLRRVGNPEITTGLISAGKYSLNVTQWSISYYVPFPITGPVQFDDGGTQELSPFGRMFKKNVPSTT